jgi:hypothetical protein
VKLENLLCQAFAKINLGSVSAGRAEDLSNPKKNSKKFFILALLVSSFGLLCQIWE